MTPNKVEQEALNAMVQAYMELEESVAGEDWADTALKGRIFFERYIEHDAVDRAVKSMEQMDG